MSYDANTPERLAGLQIAFAAHLRDPESVRAPAGIEDRRMEVYRSLFFNNVVNLLSSNFPVLRKIYGDVAWRQLARQFYTEHRAHTPLFPEVPREFLRYLLEQREDRAGDPPFLLELAHYEWVELALSQDQTDLELIFANRNGHLLDEAPYLSPLAWPLSYRYPVHRISRTFQPSEEPADPTHLLVYRTRDDVVRFMQLNAVTRLLLDQIRDNPHLTGRLSLHRIAEQLDHKNVEQLVEFGHTLLQDLLRRDIILGTRRQTGQDTAQ